MKRFWALVVALAALAVWTVPALADVKLSGQYRLRAESASETDFRDDSQGNHSNLAFYGQRVRLTGVGTVGDDATVKITLQDTRNWGTLQSAAGGDGPFVDGPGLTDGGNTLDLHESFLQINKFFGTPLSLKVGRQELVYGDQRLIGSFGWSNQGRSFDALKLMFSNDTVNVDAFTAKIEDSNVAAGDRNDDIDFHGIYATIKAVPNNAIDVYALLYKDDGSAGLFTTFGAIKAELNTYGVRLAGKAAGLDYTAEYAMQTGTFEAPTGGTDTDVDASAYAVKLGYTIPSSLGLRIGAEYDFASGTSDTATDMETFIQLFPTNHDKYGTMDQQGWQNMKAWNVNVSAKPTAKLGVRLDYWNFAVAEEADGWYNAAGVGTGIRGSGCTSCDDQMGTEVDITVDYKYSDAIGIQAGVSRFMAGKGLEDRVQGFNMTTDDTEDMDWMYVQLTANF
ncbi:MAG: alginate export family protein [Thermodesulfobacteriota bacterium]